LPYAVELATRGVAAAVAADPELALGVNTTAGAVTNPNVADALERPAVRLDDVLRP
jgi:alanine dehydrogenase